MRSSLFRGGGLGGAGDGAWVAVGGFAAGVLGTLVFHAGVLLLLQQFGRPLPLLLPVFGHEHLPGGFAPGPPFAPCATAVAALVGGFGGVVLTVILRSWRRVPKLLCGVAFGGLVVTLTQRVLAAALGKVPLNGVGDPHVLLRAGLANGALGWGTVLLLQLAGLSRRD